MHPRPSPTSPPPQAPRRRPRTRRWIAGTAAGIVIAAAGIFFLVNRPAARGPAALIPPGIPRGASSTGEPTLGSPRARVTIDEFGDFQCPYCGQFVRETEPRIIATYVATGKARIVWHTLAFIGPESALAGRAAWCAQQGGQFWEYFAVLYEHQGGENTGTFNTARLERWAGDVGLDRNAFGDCLVGPRSSAGVETGTREALKYGITATPGFLVNGQKASGALSVEELSAMIDKALAGSP
ncbi:MAG TPA: thioredoxin domain-containing protein [bacterium]|nr:thioredoxin domain-containing protein [bacterium]